MDIDKLLVSLDLQNKQEVVRRFNAFNNQWIQVSTLMDPLEKKQKLVNTIFTILKDPQYEKDNQIFLLTLRIISRDKNGLNSLFTSQRIETMLHLARLVGEEEAFLTDNSEKFDSRVVVEAQKCLSNLIFNSAEIREMCCKNSTIEGIMLRLRMYKDPKLPTEVKVFDMRILFIITALCAEQRRKIRDEYHGLIYTMEAVDLILKEAEVPGQRPSKKSQRKRKSKEKNASSSESKSSSKDHSAQCLDSASVDLCVEVLKVLWNLTVTYERNNVDEVEEAHFLRLVGILHDLLLTEAESKEKREELLIHTVNLLTNIPTSCYDELLVPIEEIGHINHPRYEYGAMNVEAIAVMLEFLERRLDKKPTNGLHETLGPILACLTSMAKSNRIIRKYLRMQILPPLKDVEHRPEEGAAIRNRLIRLMTNLNSGVKEMVASFLFVLCKENVHRFIKYTGYGNAAGLLANRGLMHGRCNTKNNYSSESEDSDTEEYLRVKEKINPITGCYEPTRPNPMEGMTEEEKEYEAMKLVDMMDRLQRTGVVQPCKIGEDGKPHPVDHILSLRESGDKKTSEK